MSEEVKETGITFRELLAIFSSVLMIAWLMTAFWGLIIFVTIMVFYFVAILWFFYFASLIESIIYIKKNGFLSSKKRLYSHGAVLLLLLFMFVWFSDMFRSERVYTATMQNDWMHYTLIFRENGELQYKYYSFGLFQTFSFKYISKSDTLIITERPPDLLDIWNIPDTLLVNTNQQAIFIRRNRDGTFETKKEWLNHYKLR